jgi:hypothetical protein
MKHVGIPSYEEFVRISKFGVPDSEYKEPTKGEYEHWVNGYNAVFQVQKKKNWRHSQTLGRVIKLLKQARQENDLQAENDALLMLISITNCTESESE